MKHEARCINWKNKQMHGQHLNAMEGKIDKKKTLHGDG